MKFAVACLIATTAAIRIQSECTLPATAAATDANTVLKDGCYHAPVSGGGLAQCTAPATAAETTRNTVHGTDGCWTKP